MVQLINQLRPAPSVTWLDKLKLCFEKGVFNLQLGQLYDQLGHAG